VHEIEELETSKRRYALALLAAVCVALVVLAVLFYRPRGIGDPEDDARVLVVEGESHALLGHAEVLGFVAVGGTLEAWRTEVSEDDEEIEEDSEVDLDAILRYADRHGFGYVVLEQPQRFDFRELEVELEGDTDFEESTTIAVLSVGDFGAPVVVTVDEPGPTGGLDMGPGPRLASALFAQPRLAEILDEHHASNEVQTRRLQLRELTDGYERSQRLQREALAAHAQLQRRVDGFESPESGREVRRILRPLEGATALPLVDGRVVVRARGGRLFVDSELSYRTAPRHRWEVIPARVPASLEARVSCPDLLADEDRWGRLAELAVSPAGDAVFVLSAEGDGELYVFDANAGPCGLRKAAEIDFFEHADAHFAVQAGGVAARYLDDGQLHMELVDLGGKRLSLGHIEVDRSSSLIWLDGDRVVALVELEEGGTALVFVDRGRPGWTGVLALRDPAGNSLRGRELLRIPGEDPALLLRWTSEVGTYKLSRLDFDRPWAALAEVEALEGQDDDDEDDEDDGGVLDLGGSRLSPELLTWTAVFATPAHVRGLDIDARGGRVALTYDGDEGVDVGIVRLPEKGGEAGALTVWMDDGYEHREVGFRRRGDELLFRTRIRLDDPGAWFLALHAVSL